MNKFINIYKGEVTLGGQDGTVLSNGDNSAPITVTLNARRLDHECVLLAVRTESGYIGYDVEISFTGQTASKWSVAKDDGYDKETVNSSASWSESVIFDTVGSTNSLFWVKAISTAEELPLDDRTVKINLKATVGSETAE